MRGLGAAIPHPFAKGAKGWGTQNSWDTCCSVCWFERLDAQQIGEDATLLGGEDTLISSGVEYRLALIQRDRAQVLESALHQRLSVHGQGDPAARGVVDAQPILGREMLEHLVASHTALALLLAQLVDLMQLLDDALLVGRGQAPECGVVAEHPLLLLDGKRAVLIKPVAQVAGRRLDWMRVARIRRTGIAGTQIRRTWISGMGRGCGSL